MRYLLLISILCMFIGGCTVFRNEGIVNLVLAHAAAKQVLLNKCEDRGSFASHFEDKNGYLSVYCDDGSAYQLSHQDILDLARKINN